MSLFKRSPRRSIATVATVGALAAAFVVVPALAAPALASDTDTATAVFTALNAERGTESGTALLPNGFANTSAHSLAIRYSGTSHKCSPSSSYPPPQKADLAFDVPICVKVAKSDTEATALVAAAVAQDSAVMNANVYNVVGIGVYTKGSKVYAFFDMLGYNTLPKEKIALSSVTISGKQAYGSTITPHYTAITDNGVSTGVDYAFKWVTKGGSTLSTTEDFTPVPTDVGLQVHAVVTVSKTGFQTVSGTSPWTAQIVKGTFAKSGGVTNGKFTQAGASLLADTPTVTPTVTPTIRWYQGSTLFTPTGGFAPYGYAPTTADLGHNLTATITYAKAGYKTLVLTYSKTPFKGLSYQYAGGVLPGPTISGYTTNPKVGDDLAANNPDWLGTATTTLDTWKVNGVTKGTGAEIVVKSSWVGKKITVTYKASGSLYKTTSVTSSSTPKVKS